MRYGIKQVEALDPLTSESTLLTSSEGKMSK